MGSNQHALRSTRTCLRVLSRALPWYHLHLRVAKTSYVLLCQYDCTLFLNIRFVRFFFLFFFVINSDSLRLHGHQGKSFHIRHGTFKYRISVSGLHTKHESSLKCSHIRHNYGLWIRNPKWKLCIRTLWLRNFRSCSWVIPWIRIVYFPSGLRLTLPFRWGQVALTPNWPIYLQEWFLCRIQYFFLVTLGPINGINSFFNSFDSAVILSAAWIRWAPDTRDHKSSSIDGLHVVSGGNNSSDLRDGAAHLNLLLWKRLWSK